MRASTVQEARIEVALEYLEKTQGASTRELADHCGLTLTQARGLLDRLYASGLVGRQHSILNPRQWQWRSARLATAGGEPIESF